MKILTQKQLESLKLGRRKGIKRPKLKGRLKPLWVKEKISQTSKGKHYSPKTEWKKGVIPKGAVLFGKGQNNIVPYEKRLRGKRHPQWKGGRILHQGKYYLILKPEHPKADQKGYVREHRLVMEEFIGRYLDKTEIIHHKNNNKLDNRLENLEIVTRSKHIKIHHKQILDARWKRI